MNQPDTETVIAQTKKWITTVVIDCNFCPFAAKEQKRGSIHYQVLTAATRATVLTAMMEVMIQLDTDATIATSLLILPGSFGSFQAYLQLIDIAETLSIKEGYEGIYQIASFHPNYLFAGSTADDAANYTNRSPYPMLHFLREDSVSMAVDSYPGIEKVPERNIAYTRQKGLLYMQELLKQCR